MPSSTGSDATLSIDSGRIDFSIDSNISSSSTFYSSSIFAVGVIFIIQYFWLTLNRRLLNHSLASNRANENE